MMGIGWAWWGKPYRKDLIVFLEVAYSETEATIADIQRFPHP